MFDPTLATAMVHDGSAVFDVCGLRCDRSVRHLVRVPCLILPAPTPIAECPPEWMDGRDMWLWSTHEKRWIEASYGSIARAWWSETEQFWYDESRATHIMLPPPSPEEATR